MNASAVRVGVIGTSWWTDAMYLPALHNHPLAEVVAVAGRDAQRTAEFADRWAIPGRYTDYEAMLDAEKLDAVVISSPNNQHAPMSLKAIERGLHVLCEKPLALNYAEAKAMSDAANKAGVKTMVPFTYTFMPSTRFIKALVDDGYIGQLYHLNMRYYSGYARDGKYMWRYDQVEFGGGVSGDLGTHWLYLARWLFGEIKAITAVLGYNVPRDPRPDGQPYTVGDDSAIIVVEFEAGGQGVIQVSSVAYEDSPFGQLHEMEFHGSNGTIHAVNDWIQTQRVSGSRAGEGPIKELVIPDEIWGNARRENVVDTYKAIFREEDFMTRGFISAIADGTPTGPTFYDGMKVQQALDATLLSAKEGRRVLTSEIK